MSNKYFPIGLVKNFSECEEVCPHSRICAQHTTASTFRYEGGMTPNLKIFNQYVCCDKQDTEKGHGALTLNKEKLEFVSVLEDLECQ